MNRPRILIIDDDPQILSLLREILTDRYEVEGTSDPNEGLKMAVARPPDLALIDVDMPVMNGFEVCAAIRASPKAARTIIVFLTSDRQASSMQHALKAGANDYLLKPFHAEELLTRIEFRLGQIHVDLPRICGNLRLDPALKSAVIDASDEQRRVSLSQQSFRILDILVQNEGRVLSREQLLSQGWDDEDISDRAVDLQIFRLRKILKGWNHRIEAIYGKGYQLVPKRR